MLDAQPLELLAAQIALGDELRHVRQIHLRALVGEQRRRLEQRLGLIEHRERRALHARRRLLVRLLARRPHHRVEEFPRRDPRENSRRLRPRHPVTRAPQHVQQRIRRRSLVGLTRTKVQPAPRRHHLLDRGEVSFNLGLLHHVPPSRERRLDDRGDRPLPGDVRNIGVQAPLHPLPGDRAHQIPGRIPIRRPLPQRVAPPAMFEVNQHLLGSRRA